MAVSTWPQGLDTDFDQLKGELGTWGVDVNQRLGLVRHETNRHFVDELNHQEHLMLGHKLREKVHAEASFAVALKSDGQVLWAELTREPIAKLPVRCTDTGPYFVDPKNRMGRLVTLARFMHLLGIELPRTCLREAHFIETDRRASFQAGMTFWPDDKY